MTKITTKTIHAEEAQGNIVLSVGGTTRLQIDGQGNTTIASGAVTLGGASDTLSFFAATPVVVQATTATTGTFTAGAGTGAVSGSSWVGNTGTKSYTVSDIVSALKKYGLLTA